MSTSPTQLLDLLSGVLAMQSNWKESAYPYPLFPGEENRQTQDHRFALGDLGSRFHASDRQKKAIGALADTTIGVKWCTRIRPDGMLGDYKAGLNAEAELIAALKADAVVGGLVRFVDRAKPTIDGDGTVMVGEFTVLFNDLYYPLS